MRAPRHAGTRRSWLVQPVEEFAQSHDHLLGGPDSVGRLDEQVDRAERTLLQPEGFAYAALDPVALDCARGVLFRHQDAEPGRSCFASFKNEAVSGQIAPRPLAQQTLELRLLPQPAGGIEPEALAARGYSPSRRRPLARRLRSTARPPRVPLRTRKPWRRARRVLEGWYVRFVAMGVRKRAVLERARARIVKCAPRFRRRSRHARGCG